MRNNKRKLFLLALAILALFHWGQAQNTPIVFPLDPSNYSNNALPPKGTSEGFTFNLRSSNNGFYGWNVRIDPDSLKVHVVNLNPVFAGSPSRATWVEQYPGPGCRYLTLDTNNNLIFGTHVYGGGWSYDTVQADEPATVLYRVVQITNDHLVVFWANAAGQDRIWVVNRAQKRFRINSSFHCLPSMRRRQSTIPRCCTIRPTDLKARSCELATTEREVGCLLRTTFQPT